MDLFKRYGTDDFDESYDHDDFEYEEVGEGRTSRPFMLRAVIAVIAVVGIAYGANLTLIGNSGNKVAEFGQGKVVINAPCDNALTVTPYAGFVNQTGLTAKFTLDSIIFENVAAACAGMDFVVQVWSDTGTTALTTSETATSPGNYVTSNTVRFYFQDSATVTMMSNQYTDVELLTDVTSTEFANNMSSFQLVYDPDNVSSFGDASQISKITVQTQNHTAHD